VQDLLQVLFPTQILSLPPQFAALTLELVTNYALGTAATSIMSYFSFVPAGGLYATCQSAAMGGYGASVAAGAAQAGAVASSALGYVWGRGG
jgi:hypothetical protein